MSHFLVKRYFPGFFSKCLEHFKLLLTARQYYIDLQQPEGGKGDLRLAGDSVILPSGSEAAIRGAPHLALAEIRVIRGRGGGARGISK